MQRSMESYPRAAVERAMKVPLTSREVREFYRHTSTAHGTYAQGTHRGPCSSVIYIDIGPGSFVDRRFLDTLVLNGSELPNIGSFVDEF